MMAAATASWSVFACGMGSISQFVVYVPFLRGFRCAMDYTREYAVGSGWSKISCIKLISDKLADDCVTLTM